jgi:hypothetical protein
VSSMDHFFLEFDFGRFSAGISAFSCGC